MSELKDIVGHPASVVENPLVGESFSTHLVNRRVRSEVFCVRVKETHGVGRGKLCRFFLTQGRGESVKAVEQSTECLHHICAL